uniref:Prostaglandin I2 (prostacyclin) synthase n=1 Tax=Eptatretus burgeri TaxID=7764 RepID=A0A8C4R535_EPTBU
MDNALSIFFITCIIIIAVLMKTTRFRLPNEPPLETAWIPWLGHALTFRRDPVAFLQAMCSKNGDVFTVRLAGRYVTFVMDPLVYESILAQEPNYLNYDLVAADFLKRLFDVTLPPGYSHADKAHMNMRYFTGRGLAKLEDHMVTNLRLIIQEYPNSAEESGSGWTNVELFKFCYEILLRTGFLTLFCPEMLDCVEVDNKMDLRRQSSEVCNLFFHLDKILPDILLGTLSYREKVQVHRLKSDIQALLQQNLGSSWIEDQVEPLAVDVEQQQRMRLALFWASQGNLGPTAFWITLYLLQDRNALCAVKFELSAATHAEDGAAIINVLHNTPVLDSAIEETLRLVAAPFLSRNVVKDLWVKRYKMADLLFRKGDRLVLFPFLSPQHDPEVHDYPHTFKYDRFLRPDGSRRTEFYKRGQRLHLGSLPWGSGNNACVAKVYATSTIKTFLFFLLTKFDVELIDPGASPPGFDSHRCGLGVMQPQHGVNVRFRCIAQERV